MLFNLVWLIAIKISFAKGFWPLDLPNPNCTFQNLRPHAALLFGEFGLFVHRYETYLFKQNPQHLEPISRPLSFYYPKAPGKEMLSHSYLLLHQNIYLRFLFFRSQFQVYIQSIHKKKVLPLILDAHIFKANFSENSTWHPKFFLKKSFSKNIVNTLNKKDMHLIRDTLKNDSLLNEQTKEYLWLTGERYDFANHFGQLPAWGSKCVSLLPSKNTKYQLLTHQVNGDRLRREIIVYSNFTNHFLIAKQELFSVSPVQERCVFHAHLPFIDTLGNVWEVSLMGFEHTLVSCTFCAVQVKSLSLTDQDIQTLEKETFYQSNNKNTRKFTLKQFNDLLLNEKKRLKLLAQKQTKFEYEMNVNYTLPIPSKMHYKIKWTSSLLANRWPIKYGQYSSLWRCSNKIAGPIFAYQLYVYPPLALFSIFFTLHIALPALAQSRAQLQQRSQQEQAFSQQMRKLLQRTL